MVVCPRKSCSGTCSLAAVEMGFREGKTRAMCRICSSLFPRPTVQSVAFEVHAKGRPREGDGSGHSGGPWKPDAADKRIQELVKEVVALKKKNESLQKTLPATADQETAAVDGERDPKDPELTARIRNAEKAVRHYKGADPELQRLIPGYDDLLAKAEVELADARACQRGRRPLKGQKQSAEAHLQKQAALLETARGDHAALLEQQEELRKAVLQSELRVSGLEAATARARQELLEVTDRMAAELRAGGGDDLTSVATAGAVRAFFGQLPAEVSGHPDGQTAMEGIMRLLSTLDGARQAAASTATGGGDGGSPGMAVPAADPAGRGGTAPPSRGAGAAQTQQAAVAAGSASAQSAPAPAAAAGQDAAMEEADVDEETLQAIAETSIPEDTGEQSRREMVEAAKERLRKRMDLIPRAPKVRKVALR